MINSKLRIIILIISILSSNLASAQHNNSFAGIRFGGVLPLGEFSSHQFGYGGYALLGRSFGAEAAWFINPKIGFGVDISSNSLGFANGYYAQDYLETEPTYQSVSMYSDPYKLATYMAGTYYKISIQKKFNSTFKLMAGLMTAHTPDQLYGITTLDNEKLTFWRIGSFSSRFTMLAGASIEYRLAERVTLLIQADFTYAQLKFNYTQGNSGYTDYMHMPVLRIQPGINIHFN